MPSKLCELDEMIAQGGCNLPEELDKFVHQIIAENIPIPDEQLLKLPVVQEFLPLVNELERLDRVAQAGGAAYNGDEQNDGEGGEQNGGDEQNDGEGGEQNGGDEQNDGEGGEQNGGDEQNDGEGGDQNGGDEQNDGEGGEQNGGDKQNGGGE